jgi:hypothetical protein
VHVFIQNTTLRAAIWSRDDKLLTIVLSKGFGACLVVGLILSLCSFLTFGHPPRFAVIVRLFDLSFFLFFFYLTVCLFFFQYTLGNLVSLCGTFFLVGPFRQLKLMVKPTRWIAAVIYL